ncbi:FAD-binding and (Fe-S)-binding domain-containing protein [Methylobacterium nonmethylotrophicum]|uniref:D-2-hydroxyglutarate dehydrogenase n=1 Tax=Methylobacterium nonmethylotrophicum TaxID=1141884 RepID=A0A4Z0NNR1_9HYPH|nr:FAD-binding and (Fe-S)-binding domain-containing protein [Methylobacterium nonmethylotrophicum]TGD97761.1 FAD-binding oxidoreductase [Methylobacterium nonmethylotrophicum]
MIPALTRLPAPASPYAAFLAELRVRGFAGELSGGAADRTVLATDNSIYQIRPEAIAFPRDRDDLIRIGTLLGDPRFSGIKVSPRGGGTGTNGQSLTGGLVVDVSRHMNRILAIDVANRLVRVEPGVVKDQLNRELARHGLFFAPELSTSNRATIGGMISTDACGQGSCLYGKTRDHVRALTTVLTDGTVWTSRPLDDEALAAACARTDRVGEIHRVVSDVVARDAALIAERFPRLNRCLTGYDLAHIRDDRGRFDLNAVLCGSEGTLGLIAEATLSVLPIPGHAALVNVRYDSFDAALRDARTLVGLGAASIETVDSRVLALARGDLVWHEVSAYFPDDPEGPAAGVNLVEVLAETAEALEAGLARVTEPLTREGRRGGRRGFTVAREAARASVRETVGLPASDAARAVGGGAQGPARLAEDGDEVEGAGLPLAPPEAADAVTRIWGMRKKAVGLLGNMKGEARPIAFVEDTAVPPENLADYIAEFRAALDRRGLVYGMFGHVDAGVLHVRPAIDTKDPAQDRLIREITEEVVALTRKYGGVLWGEHGKGVRSEFSPQVFGPLYPALQRIKVAFDPRDQLNPGKIAAPEGGRLLTIDGVPTKGGHDRTIPAPVRSAYDEALHCNGNGACFTYDADEAMCPSWKGTRERRHSPKGRAQLMREWLRLLAAQGCDPVAESRALRIRRGWLGLPARLAATLRRRDDDFSHAVKEAMDGCLACKSCVGQCPIKVDVPTFRAKFLELYHGRYLRRPRDHVVGWVEHLLPLIARAPRLANALSASPPGARLMLALGLTAMPRLSGIDLHREARRRGVATASAEALRALSPEARARSVVIVQDAFTTHYETSLVLDLVDLLLALGFTPWLAPYAPNGKPLHVHGFLGAFERRARRSATALRALAATGVDLVGIDPSMTLTYRSEYVAALGPEPAPRVQLVQEWLAARLDSPGTGGRSPSGARTAYRLLPHCTERTNAAAALRDWQTVFARLGHDLSIVPAGCCGMAGTYGHESEHRAMSEHIYGLSWAGHVAGAGASGHLLADGYSCRSQVKLIDGLHLPHPISALLRAADLARQRAA